MTHKHRGIGCWHCSSWMHLPSAAKEEGTHRSREEDVPVFLNKLPCDAQGLWNILDIEPEIHGKLLTWFYFFPPNDSSNLKGNYSGWMTHLKHVFWLYLGQGRIYSEITIYYLTFRQVHRSTSQLSPNKEMCYFLTTSRCSWQNAG